MVIEKILSMLDHTLLRQDATWEEYRQLCDEGVSCSVASVCIPPGRVKQAAEYLGGKLPICTVIGFPNGYCTTASKVFETSDAVANGADEIDMVINIGMLKECNYTEVLNEISAVRAACSGKILKVIVEACLLTESEKIKMCEIISESGADYIKTSTGFCSGGATREDIVLFSKHIAPHVKIKAAGGIRSLADAEDFINLGASRIGASSIVKAAKCL